MATSIAHTRPTAPEPSQASQARQARRSISLDAVSAPADQAVREGLLHCAIVAIGDASGLLGLKVIPGPEQPTMADDSLFFLASVTKPIVATATMQLVDEGRLDLHAPIQRVLPEFRGEHKDRVTAWHVLTHTSGVPDMDIDILRRKRPDAQWLFEHVCATPLSFEPGSRYAYGSDSFYLLAALISRLTGMPFPDALRRRVLLPVGARDVSFDPRYARRRIMTVHGVPLRNRIVRELTLRFVARATLPGGGLWGTAEDLIRFGVALLPIETSAGPRILSQAAIDEMTREQTRRRPGDLSRRHHPGATLRARLGQTRPRGHVPERGRNGAERSAGACPGLAVHLHARRRHRDTPLGRSRARPGLRIPHQRLGRTGRAHVRDAGRALSGLGRRGVGSAWAGPRLLETNPAGTPSPQRGRLRPRDLQAAGTGGRHVAFRMSGAASPETRGQRRGTQGTERPGQGACPPTGSKLTRSKRACGGAGDQAGTATLFSMGTLISEPHSVHEPS